MITAVAWTAIEGTATGGDQVLLLTMRDSCVNPGVPPASNC